VVIAPGRRDASRVSKLVEGGEELTEARNATRHSRNAPMAWMRASHLRGSGPRGLELGCEVIGEELALFSPDGVRDPRHVAGHELGEIAVFRVAREIGNAFAATLAVR
jgi:hypothetical protein